MNDEKKHCWFFERTKSQLRTEIHKILELQMRKKKRKEMKIEEL